MIVTVEDLIAKLQEFPSKAKVLRYEEAFFVREIQDVTMVNVHEDSEGYLERTPAGNTNGEDVVVIGLWTPKYFTR